MDNVYREMKEGAKAMEALGMNAMMGVEEFSINVGSASGRDIFNLVRKMRFPKRVKINGKDMYPMEGTLTKKEYELVKDLVQFDIKRNQYLTDKPLQVLKRLFDNNMLKGDRYAGLKYAIAVSAGNMQSAEETAFLWRNFMNLYNDDNLKLLKSAKFVGTYEQFIIHEKSKYDLSLDDLPEQISDMPPIWKTIYVDDKGKKYVLLVGGYGVQKDNIYSGLAVFWDEEVLMKDAGKVLNAFHLGSIDHTLFTGTGRIIEENRYDEALLYYIMEYTKFSVVQDKYTHKYIAMAGLDMGNGIAIPLVRGEFQTYEEAKKFIMHEIVPQYLEAKEEYQRLINRIEKEMEKQREMEKNMSKMKEISIGGMYG